MLYLLLLFLVFDKSYDDPIIYNGKIFLHQQSTFIMKIKQLNVNIQGNRSAKFQLYGQLDLELWLIYTQPLYTELNNDGTKSDQLGDHNWTNYDYDND